MLKLSLDMPLQPATGGNGNGNRPPERRAFARPDGNLPQNNRPEPSKPEPVAVMQNARSLAPDAVAIKAKRLRLIARRRERMLARLRDFRAAVAAWQESRPIDEQRFAARVAHESKIRRAFRKLHGKESV